MAKRRLNSRQWRVIKTAVFISCLIPFLWIGWETINNSLGSDPIQYLHFRTGEWALRFLLLTLLMSPLQGLFKTSWPLRFRRLLGLFAFFYASLHLLVWLVLDQALSLQNMLYDIPESPYIIVGLLAYGLLIPLAVTSTKTMMRRLGAWWPWLHKLVYLIALLVVIHFYWLTKLDYQEPTIYAAIFVILMGFRYKKIIS